MFLKSRRFSFLGYPSTRQVPNRMLWGNGLHPMHLFSIDVHMYVCVSCFHGFVLPHVCACLCKCFRNATSRFYPVCVCVCQVRVDRVSVSWLVDHLGKTWYYGGWDIYWLMALVLSQFKVRKVGAKCWIFHGPEFSVSRETTMKNVIHLSKYDIGYEGFRFNNSAL